MRVVVVGLGEEGHHLTRLLSQWGHEVVAIDPSLERCQFEQEHLDGLVLHGSGTNPAVLNEAGVSRADLLCAVTGSDETNLVISLVAKRLGVKRVIARLRETLWSRQKIVALEDFGVDVAIHPEWETAQEILRLLKRAAATEVWEFSDGRVQLVGVKLDPDSPWLYRTLLEISTEPDMPPFRVVAVLRAGQTLVPTGDTRLTRGDQLFLIAKSEDIGEILRRAGKHDRKIQRVMILGGGRIGRNLASLLEHERDVQIKLIEVQEEKSVQIATELQKTMVIHADGRDVDVLAQEGISEMHAFVAVTGDDENNIITSLLAKHLGVRKTITLLGRAEYLPLMTPIGLDSAVNVHTVTANTIMRVIRRGEVVSVASLPGIDAEVLEFVVSEGAPVTRKPLKDLSFPKGAILGAVTHEGNVEIPVGSTHVLPGAKVVVFCVPEVIQKVEKMLA